MPSNSSVAVRLPVDESAEFVLGAGFGYRMDDSGASWYWDGQDIWLAPGSAGIRAIAKGTLRFVPSGQPLVRSGEGAPSDADEPLPAIGDSLVLNVWPNDYVKLGDLLPKGAPVPKQIVFQNIDREEAVRAAQALLEAPDQLEHNKGILSTSEDSEPLSDEEFRTRASTWLTDQWIRGSGSGIYVEAGAELGAAAMVPAALEGVPADVRVTYPAPSGADEATWRRLTLKVSADGATFYHPACFFHTVAMTDDPQWVDRPRPSDDEDHLIQQLIRAVEALPVVNVTHQLRDDWTYGDPPDAGMPEALPDVVVHLERDGEPRKVSALFDPLRPGGGRWRVQGPLRHGEVYRWGFDGPPLYAQVEGSGSGTLEIGADSVELPIHSRHWISFPATGGSRQRKFILGVNMETCRQNHFRDLGGNDLLYQYDSTGGSPQLRLSYSHAATTDSRRPWLDRAGSVAALQEDLENIRATGATVVRVWVSEYLEGIRFEFTVPADEATGRGSALMQAREAADAGTSSFLHSRVFPEGIVHVCTGPEFVGLANEWNRQGVPFRVAPTTNPMFQRFLDNAAQLQDLAGRAGLRVLWTLLTHYGEAKPNTGKPALIYFSDDRFGSRPPVFDASGRTPAADWLAFYQSGRPDDPADRRGRLPVEAWIYRSLIMQASMRDSYIENVLRPFVRRMERAAGEAVGYEIVNEIDILWEECRHGWTDKIDGIGASDHWRLTEHSGMLRWEFDGRGEHMSEVDFAGPADLPTGWRLSRSQIREFLAACVSAVQDEVGGPDRKLIVTSVLGSEDYDTQWRDHLQHELSLVARAGSPEIRLTASSFSKYAYPRGDRRANQWKEYDGGHGVHPASKPWLRTHTSPLAPHGACLLTEASYGHARHYECVQQLATYVDLLNTTLRAGYAGVFLWHYHTPTRTMPRNRSGSVIRNPNGTIQSLNHPLSEYSDAAHDHVSHSQPFRPASSIRARPAVLAIQRFASDHAAHILPPLTTP